jgi:hypothetical protein
MKKIKFCIHEQTEANWTMMVVMVVVVALHIRF